MQIPKCGNLVKMAIRNSVVFTAGCSCSLKKSSSNNQGSIILVIIIIQWLPQHWGHGSHHLQYCAEPTVHVHKNCFTLQTPQPMYKHPQHPPVPQMNSEDIILKLKISMKKNSDYVNLPISLSSGDLSSLSRWSRVVVLFAWLEKKHTQETQIYHI